MKIGRFFARISLFVFFVSCYNPTSQNNLEKRELFYESGKLKSISFYRDSIIDSLYVHYSVVGNIDTCGIYKQGEKNGIWTEYYIDSNIVPMESHRRHSVYVNGTLTSSIDTVWDISSSRHYIASIVTRKTQPVDSAKYTSIDWYSNGQLYKQVYSDPINDTMMTFDSTGFMWEKSITNRTNGAENHEWRFYSNGKIKSDALSYSGTPETIYLEYDERGKLISRKKISLGKINK